MLAGLRQGLARQYIVWLSGESSHVSAAERVRAEMESRIDREHNAVIQGSRKTPVRPYPISAVAYVHQFCVQTSEGPGPAETSPVPRGRTMQPLCGRHPPENRRPERQQLGTLPGRSRGGR
jgi:hypothetical protein